MSIFNKYVNERNKKLAAILFGIFISLILSEGIIRLLEPINDTKGVKFKDSNRFYGFRENSTGYQGGIEFRTNSSGFRTTDFKNIDIEKDIVIIVLGDSYAFGYGVLYQDIFPNVLENKLRNHYNNKHIKVVNLAIPGYNTSQELYTLKEVNAKFKPRLILLAYHLNDIQPYSNESVFEYKNIHHMAFSYLIQHIHVIRFVMPRFASIIRSFGVKLKTTATEEIEEYIQEGKKWKKTKDILKELFKYCYNIDANVAVVIQPYIVTLNNNHPCVDAYRVVQNYCQNSNVPVINSFEYFLGLEAFKLWIHPFDGHPNAQGHALIANAAFDLIKNQNLLKGKVIFK